MRLDPASRLRDEQIRVVPAHQRGSRKAGSLLSRCVHVHEGAVHVVQARWNEEPVDKP
jgi:hypothetical protein